MAHQLKGERVYHLAVEPLRESAPRFGIRVRLTCYPILKDGRLGEGSVSWNKSQDIDPEALLDVGTEALVEGLGRLLGALGREAGLKVAEAALVDCYRAVLAGDYLKQQPKDPPPVDRRRGS